MRITTKIILGFTFTLLITVMYTATFFYLKEEIKDSTHFVHHSSLLLFESENTLKEVLDMENSLRGFLLTGKPEFLTPYYEAEEAFDMEVAGLERMLKSDIPQKERLDSVKYWKGIWKKEFAMPLINAKQNKVDGGKEYERLFEEKVVKSYGRYYISKVRNVLDEIMFHEKLKQEEHLQGLEKLMDKTNIVILYSGAGGILSLLVILIYSVTSINNRIKKMVRNANYIAKGNYSHKLKDPRKDELSALSHSLDAMSEQINEAFTSLKKSNAELEQFAYVVSHDLKAPLRAISSLSNWIEEDLGENANEEVLHHLGMLKARVVRMEALIQGILEYSKIGRQNYIKEMVDVKELLNEITEIYKINTLVVFKVEGVLPKVNYKRVRLRQVFQNLIDNAVKHGFGNQCIVTIKYWEEQNYHWFSISDNGPGISPQYHEKIFQMFQTLQARDKFESTGVGLAIVKKIVEENGGAVTVVSEEGKGACFKFSILKTEVSSEKEKLKKVKV